MEKLIFRYPGFVSKAITFTIDDGNVPMDTKLLDILKPHGIRGTFNLCSDRLTYMSHEEYRKFYEGYEIANHTAHHSRAMEDGVTYDIAYGEEFNVETSDHSKLYETSIEGYYHYHGHAWLNVATTEVYLSFAEESRRILREVFGENAAKDFVWPYFEQRNAAVKEGLIAAGYRSLRTVSSIGETTGYALPADRMKWTYNADHSNLLHYAERYAAYPDDGELKFFSFGVHSWDFERLGKWDDLRAFAEMCGDRPDTYFYAPVGEIFDYQDATLATEVKDGVVTNNSPLTVYFEYNGEKYTLKAGETVNL